MFSISGKKESNISSNKLLGHGSMCMNYCTKVLIVQYIFVSTEGVSFNYMLFPILAVR